MSNKLEGFGEASVNSPTKNKSWVSWGGDETVRIPVVISRVMMTVHISESIQPGTKKQSLYLMRNVKANKRKYFKSGKNKKIRQK